jgi:DivIVA domain-containing protein
VLHLFLYGLLAIAIAVLLFALAARFLPAGEEIAPPLRDEPPWDLPADREITADDVDEVRLPVALRGYRFAETDLLLDRLAGELRARDDEIARLRDGRPDTESVPVAAPLPPVAPGDATAGGEDDEARDDDVHDPAGNVDEGEDDVHPAAASVDEDPPRPEDEDADERE